MIQRKHNIYFFNIVVVCLLLFFQACKQKEKFEPLPANIKGESGQLRFYLVIPESDMVDLDLHVVTPYGGEITYYNRHEDGGQFQSDCRCQACNDGGWENIYWKDKAPSGTYTFFVEYYNYCKQEGFEANYTVYAIRNGNVISKNSGKLNFGQKSGQFTLSYQ